MFLFITRDIKENKDFEIELADWIFLGYFIWDTKKNQVSRWSGTIPTVVPVFAP